MAIIQKRADELKPGDIVVVDVLPMPMGATWPAPERRIVVSELPRQQSPSGDALTFFYVLADATGQQQTVSMHFQAHASVNVEVPDPIISREDLDVLLDLADTAIDPSNSPPTLQRIHEVVLRLRPPAPPTLAEALASLEALTPNPNGDPEVDVAVKLLERARRAGLLPKGDA